MNWVRGHWQLFVLLAVIFALWSTPLMVPLKILVVFFHELSHAAVTILTGGEVISLTVSADQGGMVVSRGGSRFWTLTAGYLGSLLIGLALLIGALRSHADRLILVVCGICLLLCAALYIRDVFALAFTFGTGASMCAVGWWLRNEISDLALRTIGLASMIYVPYDILSDTILRSNLQSDARMLAEEIGGATLIWGGIWLAISVLTIGTAIRLLLRDPSNISFGNKLNETI